MSIIIPSGSNSDITVNLYNFSNNYKHLVSGMGIKLKLINLTASVTQSKNVFAIKANRIITNLLKFQKKKLGISVYASYRILSFLILGSK